MKYHKLKITQEDIEKGQKRRPTACAVAQAVKRTKMGKFPFVCFESENELEARLDVYDQNKCYKLSPDGVQFMRDFDRGLAKPTTIEMVEVE